VLALKRPRGLTQRLYLHGGLAAQGAFPVALLREVGLEVVLVRGRSEVHDEFRGFILELALGGV
jgi:hypothetical protein